MNTKENLSPSRNFAPGTTLLLKKTVRGWYFAKECNAFSSSVKWRFDWGCSRTVRQHGRKPGHNCASLYPSFSEICISCPIINSRVVSRQESPVCITAVQGLESYTLYLTMTTERINPVNFIVRACLQKWSNADLMLENIGNFRKCPIQPSHKH